MCCSTQLEIIHLNFALHPKNGVPKIMLLFAMHGPGMFFRFSSPRKKDRRQPKDISPVRAMRFSPLKNQSLGCALGHMYAPIKMALDQCLPIPLLDIIRAMNIHVQAILMFSRGQGFWPPNIPKSVFFSRRGVSTRPVTTNRSRKKGISYRLVYLCLPVGSIPNFTGFHVL